MSAATPDRPIVELGRGLPGWLIRLVSFVAGAGAVLAIYPDVPVPAVIGVLLALALLAAAVPASPAPAALITAVAIALAFAGGDPLRPEVLLEIPLLHLVHVTASVAGLAPLRSVVRPGALARPAVRFLAVQAGVFAVVGITEILPTGQNTTIVEVIGLIGVTTLVLVTIRLLTREE